MKQYKKFLFGLLIFAVIILLADQLFGLLFRPVFRLQERGKYFTTSHAIEGSGEDIIIFGNSHAAQHFNANRITDSLQITAFNYGNQWQSLLYYYPVLESVLLHHHPKLVILNLDPDELLYRKTAYDRLSILLPYYKQNSYIDTAVHLISKFEKYKALSNFYRYNSTIGYICLNLFTRSYGKSVLSKGYDPQDGVLCKLNLNDIFISEDLKEDTTLDTIKIRFLKQMIADLQRKNINLLVTFAPVYKSGINNSPAFHVLTSILSEKCVEYNNYYTDNRFSNNCTLFNDQNHLNSTGANIFTDVIIKEIQERKLLLPHSKAYDALSSK